MLPMLEKQQAPHQRKRIILLSSIVSLAVVFLGIGGVAAKAVMDRSDYPFILDWADRQLLQRTEVGRYYRDMALRHSSEMINITKHMTISRIAQMVHVFDLWMPNFGSVEHGYAETTVISKEQVDALTESLLYYANNGSPSLQSDITTEMKRLNLPDFIGMTMSEAWVHLHKRWGVTNPPSISDFMFIDPSISTQVPMTIYNPETTLEGGEFARFWAEYRDLDDSYGFAYPADWVLRIQPDLTGNNKWMMVCNHDTDSFRVDNPTGICVFIVEDKRIVPTLPVDQAAYELICGPSHACDPIILIPEEPGQLERAEVQFSVLYDHYSWASLGIVYRNPAGKMIVFYSDYYTMQTPEANAIVDSFVLGDDTPIPSPDFEPSKRI
jgi:hypothetical protein